MDNSHRDVAHPWGTITVDSSHNPVGYSLPNFPEASRPVSDAAKRREHTPDEWVIPHPYTFASLFNLYNKTYRSYFDVALRESFQNAVAMRNDSFLMQLIRARQMPVVGLPFRIEPDDPDDEDQAAIAGHMEDMIRAIPERLNMFLHLQEAIWYGKSGVQVIYDWDRVDEQDRIIVRDWVPVQGDKIIWKWDTKTPGILVHQTFTPPRGQEDNLEKDVKMYDYADRGVAFYLKDPFFRKQFVIHRFERSDTDYLYEDDLAGQVGGVGLRHRLYGYWNVKAEVFAWVLDGLQRISTNGQLVAWFEEGNKPAEDATIKALKQLSRDSIAAFPRSKFDKDTGNSIQHFDASNVAYQEMKVWIDYLDDVMRRMVLGQDLSSKSSPQGLGNGAADFQQDTLKQILTYDAVNLGETITEQLVKPLIGMNEWEWKGKKVRKLPFKLHFKFKIEAGDALQRIQVAQGLVGLGAQIDATALRDEFGFSAPKEQPGMPGAAPGMPPGGPGMPPGAPPAGGPPGAPPEGQPAPGGPPGAPGEAPAPEAGPPSGGEAPGGPTATPYRGDRPVRYSLKDHRLLMAPDGKIRLVRKAVA